MNNNNIYINIVKNNNLCDYDSVFINIGSKDLTTHSLRCALARRISEVLCFTVYIYIFHTSWYCETEINCLICSPRHKIMIWLKINKYIILDEVS